MEYNELDIHLSAHGGMLGLTRFNEYLSRISEYELDFDYNKIAKELRELHDLMPYERKTLDYLIFKNNEKNDKLKSKGKKKIKKMKQSDLGQLNIFDFSNNENKKTSHIESIGKILISDIIQDIKYKTISDLFENAKSEYIYSMKSVFDRAVKFHKSSKDFFKREMHFMFIGIITRNKITPIQAKEIEFIHQETYNNFLNKLKQ